MMVMPLVRQAPVIRVLLPFCGGILAGYPGREFLPLPEMLLLCVILTAFQLLIYYSSVRGRKRISTLILVPAMLTFFLAGMAAGGDELPRDPGIPLYERVVVEGEVRGEPREEEGEYIFELEVMRVGRGDSIWMEGHRIGVSMAVSVGKRPERGECWLLTGTLRPVKGAMNPGETDFRKVLGRKDRWYYMGVDSLESAMAVCLSNERRSFSTEVLRHRLSASWIPAGDEGKVLRAICLGDKSALDSELRASFARAGGGHVLAVSGLHVGLLWWILDRLLFFLVPGRAGPRIRGLILIFLLWAYAGLTGLSPSVCRSVCMFTFWCVSRFSGTRGQGLNMLLVSFFALVLLHPLILFDLGFQLSYAAVFSILILHPVLSGFLTKKRGILPWIWNLTSLSLAAQFGTLPLVLYYFHGIPLYALVSNLVAIPLLSAIVFLFIFAFPSLILGAGPGWISELMLILSRLLLGSMEWIGDLPGSYLSGFRPDAAATILLMTMIAGILLVLRSGRRLLLYPLIVLAAFFLLRSSFREMELERSSSLVVHHFYGGSALTFQRGHQVDHYLWIEEQERVWRADRMFESGWGGRKYERSVIMPVKGRTSPGAFTTCLTLYDGIWLVGNEEVKVLVLRGNQCGDWSGERIIPDATICLLSGEPEIPARWQEEGGGLLVADGSNRRWFLHRLAAREIFFHSTAEEGALVWP